MNKIEVYKTKKGTIRKYDETIKLNKGSYLILVGRIKIFLGTCENGKHLCDNYFVESDQEVGRFFRIYVFLFGMIYNKKII